MSDELKTKLEKLERELEVLRMTIFLTCSRMEDAKKTARIAMWKAMYFLLLDPPEPGGAKTVLTNAIEDLNAPIKQPGSIK